MFAHDTSTLAWLITAAYFGAAVLAFAARRRAKDHRDRTFWTGCSALLALLGLNKQLDLQGYITSAGRFLARQEGWFSERRLVQETFIVILCIAALASLAFLALWLRRSSAVVRIAGLGLVLLFTFILWRAASFHHMDIWVTHEIAGMRSGWWLELSGILVVGLSAAIFCRRNRAVAARL